MDNKPDAEAPKQNEHEYDMANSTPVKHRYDKIIGNQLTCSLHEAGTCPVIFVKPTEVLVKDEEGVLHLFDKGK